MQTISERDLQKIVKRKRKKSRGKYIGWGPNSSAFSFFSLREKISLQKI